MSRWPIKPLSGHILEVSDRKGARTAEILSVTNDSGFVRSLDVFDKQVFSEDASSYKLVGFDDLAYNPSRINVGSVARCNFDAGGAVSPMYVVVRCRPTILPQYLLYFLRSEIGLQNIRHRCEGAIRFQLRYSDLERIELPIPPRHEQERIVELLDEAEALRKASVESSLRASCLTTALFNQTFVGANAKTKNWRVTTLGECCRFIGGSSLPSGVPFCDQSGGFLLVKVGDMNAPGNETFISRSREWVESGAGSYSNAPNDTLVIPKRGGSIATNKKRLLTRPALLDPNLMGILANKEAIHTEYLLAWFLSFDLTKIASGSTVPQLNKQDLAPLPIAIPPMALQTQFAQRVVEIRALEAEQAASRKRLDDLFQSLLHRAFSGDL